MTALLENYGAALFAFALFALFHSFGAHEAMKNVLARWTSAFVVEHFWRLTYCALSLAALYGAVSPLLWGRHPDNDVWLVVYPEWLWQTLTALHLGSIGVLYVAFLQSDYPEFLGLTQASRRPGAVCARWPAGHLSRRRWRSLARSAWSRAASTPGCATRCWRAASCSC